MNYLLDTCLVSELIKRAPEPQVIEWVRQQDEQRLYLSVLTIGEVQAGIAKLTDANRAEKLKAWLDDDLQARFDGRILDVTPRVARIWGRFQGQAKKEGKPLPAVDSLIAATALDLCGAVVTRNVGDVERTGVQIFDPWPRGR